ncbi:hypothetical protein NDU88_005417 [Pleurodeles waltl]|uniref:Core-binding (CB) domain-containing protein n=1 Tax=Pleurodeles waltl TaxID=8319 RepID=A0AAV7SLU7_PLEWA|nr:hypothetical protein NDU88_005417 [Pleurodeles waltl]
MAEDKVQQELRLLGEAWRTDLLHAEVRPMAPLARKSAVDVAAAVWACSPPRRERIREMQHKRVLFRVDNLSVVQMVNRQSAREAQVLQLLRVFALQLGESPWVSIGRALDQSEDARRYVEHGNGGMLRLVMDSLAPSTRRTYMSAWREFVRSGAWRRVGRADRVEDVVRFIMSLIARGQSRVTIADKLVALGLMG